MLPSVDILSLPILWALLVRQIGCDGVVGLTGDVALEAPDDLAFGQAVVGASHHALNAEADHDELRWDAVGTEWPVPIDKATVSVRALTISELRCHTGRQGWPRNCDRAEHDQQTATITHNALDTSEGITLIVTIPKNHVTVTPPRYTGPHPVLWAIVVVGGAMFLLFVCLLALWPDTRRRRDDTRRRRCGSTTGGGYYSSKSGSSSGGGFSSSGGVGGGVGGGGGGSHD